MFCQQEVRRFIQDMAYSKFSEEAIFNSVFFNLEICCQIKMPLAYKISQETNQEAPCYHLTKQILNIIREEIGKVPDLPEQTMEDLYESMEKVSDWTEQERPVPKKCFSKFLSPRFGIDLSFWSEKHFLFNLLDLSSGETRQLLLDGNVDLVKSNFDIFELDINHFLINTLTPRSHANFEEFRMRTLYLMEMDRNKLICKVLDEKNFPQIIESVVKDGSCCRVLYLIYNKIHTTLGNTCNMQKCCFTDSTITFENTVELNIPQLGSTTGFYYKSIRINENEMNGLMWISTDEYRLSFVMASVNLEGTRASITSKFEVEMFGKDRLLLPPPNFVWCGQKLFVVMKDYEPDKYLALEIDLETGNQISIQPKLNIDHSLSRICDMIVSDGILLVCAVTKSRPLHFNRRIPLSRPDKLENIATTQLNRQKLFMEEEQRENMLKRLPATMFN